MYALVIISQQNKEIDREYHYLIPDEIAGRAIGSRVIVPFGRGDKPVEGYIVGVSESCEIDRTRIKSVVRFLDDYPAFTEEMLKLGYAMRERYFTSLGACLAGMIPAGIKMRGSLRLVKKRLAPSGAKAACRLTKGQKTVIDYLNANGAAFMGVITEQTGVSRAVVSNMIKKGLLAETEETIRRKPYIAAGSQNPDVLSLTGEQRKVYDFIAAKIERGDSKPTLLKGVTGSGKTEVYIRLVENVLEAGRQAIVLVPEISLTPQTVGLFTARFGADVSVTHSRLSAGERFDQWERARLGEISVMIGPRSAVFAPFQNPGIIIIDEEHERSYKSDYSPKYSAYEIAKIRCGNLNAALVAGSATPRLETYYESQNGQIDICRLTERINKRMPEVEVIDMRKEMTKGNMSVFSGALVRALAETVESGFQAILFLNRRGHSTFVSCRVCGYVMTCAECSVNYTYHRLNGKLVCHYCGRAEAIPQNCPVCGSKYIKYFGAGTQRIEDEAKRFLPNARILRMDSDTTAEKHAHEKILTRFRQREADILIGTQMIAKGLDYPSVTLVGIISADTSINLGDFRSGETTFQLLTQVAGRAGRAERAGRVVIQTYSPEHYSVVFAKEHDYEGFYEYEMSLRRQMMYPPYMFIFGIMFAGCDEKRVISSLFKLAGIMGAFNKDGAFETIGPAPEVVSKINGVYRWRLIVKSSDEDRLRKFCLYCVDKLRAGGDTDGITIHLTPNPY